MAEKEESLAKSFVRKTYQVRLWTMIVGGLLSLLLIIGGFCLTQRDLGNNSQVETATKDTEVTVDVKIAKFALKNTAPGLVLIICGTLIAIFLIKKKTWYKTQWEDKQNAIPGYTEANG